MNEHDNTPIILLLILALLIAFVIFGQNFTLFEDGSWRFGNTLHGCLITAWGCTPPVLDLLLNTGERILLIAVFLTAMVGIMVVSLWE